MKNSILVIFGLFVSVSSQAAASGCADWMTPMAQSESLKRGQVVGELLVKKTIVAKAGASEVTIVDASGTHVTVRFHKKLEADLTLDEKAQMRMMLISDHEDNQSPEMNCGSSTALCIHVDHPEVDTITFSREKVGKKQLSEAGLEVCNL